jgi:hypothetical protein
MRIARDPGELAPRRLEVFRLVVSDPQVEPHRVLVGGDGERLAVAPDGLAVEAQARVDDAEVRERVEAARHLQERRLVGGARAFEVPFLLQLDAAREILLGLPHGGRVLRRGERQRENENQVSEHKAFFTRRRCSAL